MEGQAVGPVGDHDADGGGDERPAVLDQAAGEMVVAVLGGEVPQQVLPPLRRARARRRRRARRGGQAGPGGGAGPVELPVQGRFGPLQPGAAADDEQAAGHQPHHTLQQPLEVAVAVGSVLEGVQQDRRRDLLAVRQPGKLPRQQMRVVGQRLQIGFGLQQRGQPRAAGQRLHRLAPLAQRPDQRVGDLPRRCRAAAAPGRRRSGRSASAAAAPCRTVRPARRGRGWPPTGRRDAAPPSSRAARCRRRAAAAQQQRRARPGWSARRPRTWCRRSGPGRSGRARSSARPRPVHPTGRAAARTSPPGFELAQEGGLAYAAHSVEGHDVGARRFEVGWVEAGGGGVPQVFFRRGGEQLPLALTVGERLARIDGLVRAEQGT